MPKQSVKAEVNTFVQGLITEASPLNFPANASFDEVNFELNRDGTRDRRLGFMQENGGEYVSPVLYSNTAGRSKYEWPEVAGNPNLSVLVVQYGRRLAFFNLEATVMSEPFTGWLGSVDLPLFSDSVNYSYAAVDGKLVVAGGDRNIYIVEFNGSGFLASTDTIKTRDLWGVETFLETETDPSFRPNDLGGNSEHYYNLQNQSWGIPRRDTENFSDLRDPVFSYFGVIGSDWYLGKYPSNSEVVWTGMQFQPVSAGQEPFEKLFPNLFEEAIGSDAKAPKGYYIIDALARGVSRMSEFTRNGQKYPETVIKSISLPQDTTNGGSTVIAEFAGRVFYAGFSGTIVGPDARSPNLTNYIFFSQLVKSKRDIVRCYQEGDPTSRENSDVVDTDGGFLRVSGAEGILALINLSTSLIIIAKNGVWSLTGGSDYGFSATNYKLDKISSFGGISASSIIEDGSSAFFWGPDGIYSITKNQFGEWEVNNITQRTIQNFYENIPAPSKATAVGAYDTLGRKLRWVYKEGVEFTNTSETKELILDTVLGAFYRYDIGRSPNNQEELLGIFSTTPFIRDTFSDSVLVNTDEVFSNTDQVVIGSIERESNLVAIKYVILRKNNINNVIDISFGLYNNSRFVDWEHIDGTGVDAKAFLITGSQTGGDTSIAKQIPYLITHFRKTETETDINGVPFPQSGCLVRSQWDFANSANSKKWGPLFQAYRHKRPYIIGPSQEYDNGFEVVSTKNKLRGRGKAFALYMETEPLKDCRILGWSISLNGNSIT